MKQLILFSIMCLLLLPLANAQISSYFIDEFDDNVINTVRWFNFTFTTSGNISQDTSLTESQGLVNMTNTNPDNPGGSSQISLGIFRNKYNYNDGRDHTIRFSLNFSANYSDQPKWFAIELGNGSLSTLINDGQTGLILYNYSASPGTLFLHRTNYTIIINSNNNSILLFNDTGLMSSSIHTQNNSNWSFQIRSVATNGGNVFNPNQQILKMFNFRSDENLFNITNVSFNANTLEGTTETFRINITFNSSVITGLSTIFTYNNTNYTATTSDSGTNRLYTTTLSVPGVNSQTNVSFFWNFIATDIDSNTLPIYSDVFTQSVNNINLDNCTNNNIQLLNLTARDEDTQTALTTSANDNLTVNIDLDINNIIFFNQTFLMTNPVLICISANLTSNASLDAQIQYSAFDHVTEFYHLQNFTINNGTIPLNISLYDLDVIDSQEFLITVKGTNFLPLTGALVEITRKYIGEGVFKTVEIPLTDSLGRTIGHFVLADQIYTILVKKNGQILGTFENVQLACQDLASGDCRLNLNLASTGTEPEDFTKIEGIQFYINYDENTRIVTGTFSTIDGSIQTINLNVTTSINNSFVCSNSLTSNSGSLSCTVPSSFNNVQVTAKLSKGQTFLGQKFIFIVTDSGENVFGELAYFVAFLIILCMCLMTITDRQVMLIFAMIGLILCVSLLIIDGASVLGIGSVALYVIISGSIYIWKIGRVTR